MDTRSKTSTLDSFLAGASALGASALAAGLALSGCNETRFLNPSGFDRFAGASQIVVTPQPAGASGASGFGSVLVGYETLLPDIAMPGRFVGATRYVAAAGADSAYFGFRVFDENVVDQLSTSGLRVSVDPLNPRYSGCLEGQFCGPGSSLSVAAVPLWRQDPTTVRYGCVAAPSGNAIVDTRIGARREQVQVRCEPTSSQIQTLDVPAEGVSLGASGVGLPADHAVGAALFGAPGDLGGTGALYRLEDWPSNALLRVTLDGLPSGAGIGRSLAMAPLDDGSILVATGGAGRDEDALVAVATLAPDGTSTLRACLRGTGSRGGTFGSALAFGDFDGDGMPDLAVGAGDGGRSPTAPTDIPVQLFDGSVLATADHRGCEDPPREPLSADASIACPDGLDGLPCSEAMGESYAGFGASLAVGDVDADGRDDLIVGAPHASLRAAETGAVIVLGGGGTFTSVGMERSVLTYSSIRASARLGTAVATVPGIGRDEIVAGAPGAGSVVVFFCSGIAGDEPSDFLSMAGVTHGCVAGPTPRGASDAGTARPDASVVPADAGSVDAGVSPEDAATLDAAEDDAATMDVDADVDAGP